MSDMVEVVVDSVRVSLMSSQRVIILRQTDSERYLPIWVGPYEAEAITVALQEIEMIRPLTHDLLKNTFALFNARVLRIEIVDLRDDIFYGRIVVEDDGRILSLDSRPSDAIALAVRLHVPILVSKAVMEAAAIVPEQDIEETSPSPTPAESLPPSSPASPESSASPDERLDVFEDFLKKLDQDKGDEEAPAN